ncbi:kinesin-like protein costa [Drosophila sulfurigaster albostrigata]|uniref:kinesin-like protein costa n=1 Tax=Drosophila sulfurigaster albostrigata TaxID=89887 RepID=UPI002D21A65E|nr:kinesin-like protein costa [Drosophila sulfurigaster albostrigata]
MEIPIQVAVRIYPHAELQAKPQLKATTEDGDAEADKPQSELPSSPPTPSTSPSAALDANGNNSEKETATLNTNDTPENGSCVQAIPITASALGLPSALPGGAPLDSIAAGLIQVGAHTVPVTHALPSSTTQCQVYHQTVFPLISLFLEGFDASVVTYGQRKTGKTYTLYGHGFECVYGEADQGVVQRCVREIFTHIAAHTERTYAVNVGFVEICNGEVRDLLGMGNVHCRSVEEVFHWLKLGLSKKLELPAHTLFTMTLEQQWISKDGLIQHRLSTASFSDLSGTDRYGEPPPGYPRDPGLHMLEQVINTLTDPGIMYSVNGNIPYGQTTLTTLLKDSFGGRAQTLLILCVSPLEQHLTETLGNLQFGYKVQCVRNYVIMNTFSDDNTPIAPETMPNEQAVVDRAALMAAVGATNAENFGLQFAASQWFKLVSNAEGLFAKLIGSNAITEMEKEQMEEWLFLKQECEECLSSSDVLRQPKPLVPIEEAEEPESVSEPETSCQQNSDNESDNESQGPDLDEKLDSFMDEFRSKTDTLIKAKHEEFMLKQPKAVMQSQDKEAEQLKLEPAAPTEVERCDERKASTGGRRRSIQPGASLSSAELAMLNRVASQQTTGAEVVAELDPLESAAGVSTAVVVAAVSEPIEQVQKKMRKLHAEIEARQRQLKEIEQTMQLKQNIISELVKNRETRSHVKQRFHKKKAKLDAECEKAKKHLAKALVQGKEKAEVERWSAIVAHIEHRLEDLNSMKHIAGESGQKLKKLQQSVAESRKQIEELQKKLKKECKLRDQLEAELKSLKEASLVKLEPHPDQLKAVQARITHLDHILREKSENLELGDASDQSPREQEGLRHEIRNLRRTRDHLLEQRCTLDRKLKRDKMLTQREERKLLECDEAIMAIDEAIEFKNELICGRKSIDLSTERLQREKGEQMLMARLNKLSSEEMRTLLYKYFVKVIDLRDSSRKLEQQLVQLERERDAWEWKERVLSNAVRQARLEGERNAVLLQRQHETKLTLMLRHLAEETSTSSASYGERALAPAHPQASSDFDYELDFYKTTGDKVMLKTPQAKPTPTVLEKYKDKERSGGRNIFAKFQVLTRYASAAAAAAGSSSTADESTALIETTTTTATTTTTTATTSTAAAALSRGKEHALVKINQDQLKRLMPPPTSTKVTRQKNKIIIQDASRNN